MVEVGQEAPALDLLDERGNRVRLGDFRGAQNVVLFFYPKDNTPVCNIEACAFRDAYAEFAERGTVVLGVSDDDAASHQAFAKQWSLPFPLLCDPGGAVRKRYGVTSFFGLFTARVTFVIDTEGIVRAVVRDRLNAQRHVREALAALAQRIS